MKSKYLIIGLLITKFTFGNTEKKYTQQEYVEMWKETAIQQMNTHKIPASITLAQGILESGNGNSLLAQKANNHFGIKCSNWNGETFHKDDDQKGECFRKYDEAKKSFEDHSTFLTSKTRYSALFNLEITDYKAWAKGLKEAGYATNPKYPQLLIDIIERNKLNEFDQKSNIQQNTKTEVEKNIIKTINSNSHTVIKHKNNIKYIIAKKGDTFYRISKEFQLGLWQLYKYNEFGEKKDYLVEGDIVYLEPKKRKSNSEKYYIAKEETNLRIIAQSEGIKLKRLLKMNEIDSPEKLISKGDKIKLR